MTVSDNGYSLHLFKLSGYYTDGPPALTLKNAVFFPESIFYVLHILHRMNSDYFFNPLNAELNPICYLLALLAHHFLHVSRIRVKSLTLRLLMAYIYIYIWSAYS